MRAFYNQGDIIEADFNPASGHEPKKRRSAVVISTDTFNNVLSSLTVVCPIATLNNGHPLHIEIAEDNDTEGFICIEQLRAIDLSSRNCKRLGSSLDQETMAHVLDAIGAVFGI